MRIASLSNQLIILTLILFGLYVGKDLLIPFIIAVVVWYLLNSLADIFGRMRLGKRVLPRTIQLLLAFALLIGASFFLIEMILLNYEFFIEQYPAYHANFIQLTASWSQKLDLTLLDLDYASSINIPALLADAIDSSLGFVTTFFLILLYVVFLLLEQQIFRSKLKQIFKDRSEYLRFLKIVKRIDESIYSYVSIKTALCLLSGFLSYWVMFMIGIDFAILWAFLIFMLNFIPIIGALIGVLFPSLIALLQFGSYGEPVLVFSLLASIQLIVGNFVEPKVLGTRLNVSPLVVILALTFWGAIWGVAGMFLCVPITVILMIILSQFEKTRSIAVLFSAGKVV